MLSPLPCKFLFSEASWSIGCSGDRWDQDWSVWEEEQRELDVLWGQIQVRCLWLQTSKPKLSCRWSCPEADGMDCRHPASDGGSLHGPPAQAAALPCPGLCWTPKCCPCLAPQDSLPCGREENNLVAVLSFFFPATLSGCISSKWLSITGS